MQFIDILQFKFIIPPGFNGINLPWGTYMVEKLKLKENEKVYQ